MSSPPQLGDVFPPPARPAPLHFSRSLPFLLLLRVLGTALTFLGGRAAPPKPGRRGVRADATEPETPARRCRRPPRKPVAMHAPRQCACALRGSAGAGCLLCHCACAAGSSRPRSALPGRPTCVAQPISLRVRTPCLAGAGPPLFASLRFRGWLAGGRGRRRLWSRQGVLPTRAARQLWNVRASASWRP